MKWLLLLPIRAYWRLWPAVKRKRCLFRESCSRFVYRTTEVEGFRAGLKALVARHRACRPGYRVCQDEQTVVLRLADGTMLPEASISQNIMETLPWSPRPRARGTEGAETDRNAARVHGPNRL